MIWAVQCGLSCILGLTTISFVLAGCKIRYSRILEQQINDRVNKVLAKKRF